jgi:hypothetical protein
MAFISAARSSLMIRSTSDPPYGWFDAPVAERAVEIWVGVGIASLLEQLSVASRKQEVSVLIVTRSWEHATACSPGSQSYFVRVSEVTSNDPLMG